MFEVNFLEYEINCGGTNLIDIENPLSVDIYPNPVNDKIYVDIETGVEIEDVLIYDIYGRRLDLSAVSHQPSVIDVKNLKSGIYFVKIKTEEGNIVKRFIKQ